MKLKLLFFLTSILLLKVTSVNSQAKKLLKQGYVVQESFTKTMPFEYKYGLIVLKIDIKNKLYNFILDTGASNVVSKEVATALKLSIIDSTAVKGIHNQSQELAYAIIPNLNISDLDFKETLTAIVDLKSSELSQYDIDGILGANLMRHAIWDFDFVNKKITITNNEKNLNLPKDITTTKMFIGFAGQPSIITKVNGKRVLNNVIDTGNNGDSFLSTKVFKKQKKRGLITEFKTRVGETSLGIYGRGKESEVLLAKVNSFNVDGLTKENFPMLIKNNSNNLSVNFFKNYRLILNWKTKKVKLLQLNVNTHKRERNLGFTYNYNQEKGKLYVSSLYKETKVATYLKLGDQLVEVNDKDYKKMTTSIWKEILKEGLMIKDINDITILREGKEYVFKVEKEFFFNKM